MENIAVVVLKIVIFSLFNMVTPLSRKRIEALRAATQRVADYRDWYALKHRKNAYLLRSGGGTRTITTTVCARPGDAPHNQISSYFQDQANLRTSLDTLYGVGVSNPKFLSGKTVKLPYIDALSRKCAGSSYPTNYLKELMAILRKIGILGTEETVVPFSLVEDECVVPYPDCLATISLQVINNEGGAINQHIHVFETFEVSRVKV